MIAIFLFGAGFAKAQTVFVAPTVRITATNGNVMAVTPQGTKVPDIAAAKIGGVLSPEIVLLAGSTIETESESHAFLTLPSAGTLMLGPNSQLKLPAAGTQGHSLELVKGQLFASFNAADMQKLGAGSIRVKTPTALLAVKGARFFVESDGTTDTTGVSEGGVAVYELVSRKIVELQAGSVITTTKGIVGQTKPLTAMEKQRDIFYEISASGGRLTNILGMQFVPLPGTDALICIHETRHRDYAAYAAENPGAADPWENLAFGPDNITERLDDHPVQLRWDDAQAFCGWLSKKEKRTYRLTTDREWSIAVGLGDAEDWKPGNSPATARQFADIYPWGNQMPPPPGVGNFSDDSLKKKYPELQTGFLNGYDDGYVTTAPVMSFRPNSLGVYDLAGNLSEWVQDYYDDSKTMRVFRGASWLCGNVAGLRSSSRSRVPTTKLIAKEGFRLMLVGSPQSP